MFSKIFQWKNMFLNTKRPVIAINQKLYKFWGFPVNFIVLMYQKSYKLPKLN